MQTTTRDWKLDTEASIKHDDLWGRSWEIDYEKPIFVKAEDEPYKSFFYVI